MAKFDYVKIINDMEQDTSLVAFTTTDINIYKISDCMHKEFNWEFNAVQFPSAVHFCVTERTAGCEEKFIEDFKKAHEMVKNDPGNKKYNTWAPVYGATAIIPTKATLDDMVGQVIAGYCDVI